MRLFYLFSLLFIMSSCTKEKQTDNLEATITKAEIEDLSFLREEEKLARDVYLYAYDLYGATIFNNISNSEQTHMDKVLELLTYYNIQDSASSQRGVFNNKDLAAIYSNLTSLVEKSLTEALTVGATIEDLDINDINHFLDNTNKVDLITVYENLNCGSKNHIRAFNWHLTSLGSGYTAQYISEAELQEILDQESGGCGI